MNKYNISKLGDQEFWAYAFLSKEHIKYSQHNMDYVPHNKVYYEGLDLIYIHSPDITNAHASTIPKLAHSKGIKVVGAYAGSPVFWSPAEKRIYEYSDLIVTISPQTYEFAKFHYNNHPIIFLPESVDANFFYPDFPKMHESVTYKGKLNKKDIIVGWAGGAHKKIKRTFLLPHLDFEVKVKSDWKNQRRNKVTTLDHMIDFYRSIDVLVITSISECMPRVALEAMACGLPVISTDVGGMRMLIDNEFIVPVNPEEDCVAAINDKLHLLNKYPELRKAVGIRNRHHITDHWSWEKNVSLWDEVFSLVVENKVYEAVILADKFLDNFKKDFDLMRTRFHNKYLNKPIEEEKILPKKAMSTGLLKRVEHEEITAVKPIGVLTPKQQVIYDVTNCNIDAWLLDKTCLECILYEGKKIKSNYFTFGVDNIVDAVDIINDLEGLNWNHIWNKLHDLIVEKDGITIEIKIDPQRKTKTMSLLDMQVLVPFPVIKYLRTTFGNDWENLK